VRASRTPPRSLNWARIDLATTGSRHTSRRSQDRCGTARAVGDDFPRRACLGDGVSLFALLFGCAVLL